MSDWDTLVDELSRINGLNDRQELLLGTGAARWHNYLHLQEEVGEVARCIRGKNDEPLENECVDVVICALALGLSNVNGDWRKLVEVLHNKLDKWESRLNKKKE